MSAKKPTAKQLAARKKFAAMAKARAGKRRKKAAPKKTAKKKVAKRVVKPAAKKRKTVRSPKQKWFCVYALVKNVKYYDTGAGKLVTDKKRAEKYATIETARAAAANIGKRLRVAHQGIFAEHSTAPKK